MPSEMKWSFAQIWNESLQKGRPEREFKARNTIWASELGGSMVDRYLKYIGDKPTNPPNQRSLRKFEAGNIWEWIVGLVLKRAGILLDEQGWVKYTHTANGKSYLPVTGKKDFVAGGKPDWEKAKADINQLGLPEFLDRATNDIIDYFKEKYPEGLAKVILEVKSSSSFMFDRYEALKTADPKHKLQLFHYLKADNLTEGHIIYICKDDCRMLEIGVMNPGPVEEEYIADIERFSWYIFKGEQPKIEKEIVFQSNTFRFSPNYKVGYSNYLTKLYGYKDQMEFDTKYRSMTARWNRVLNRMVNESNMTKLNLEVIKEIKKEFPYLDSIVEDGKLLKQKGLIQPESED